MYKKGDKFNLKRKYFKNIKAYIIGLNKNYFINQFRNKIKSKYFGDTKKAISAIKNDMQTNSGTSTILFSPAAASFDQFKNFEERGLYFNKIIKQIIIKKK